MVCLKRVDCDVKSKNREVSWIITCTFKRVYIKNTVDTILQDKLLQSKDLNIFVVDNGKSLNEDDFRDPRVKTDFE